MLKTLSIELAMPRKGIVGVGYSREKYGDRTEPISRDELDGNKVKEDEVGKKDQKTFKSKNLFKSKKLSKSKKIVRSLDFFTPEARLVFTKLKQVFVKALIFYHFDSKRHIQIKTDVLNHAIGEVFSQLTLDNLG